MSARVSPIFRNCDGLDNLSQGMCAYISLDYYNYLLKVSWHVTHRSEYVHYDQVLYGGKFNHRLHSKKEYSNLLDFCEDICAIAFIFTSLHTSFPT